LSVENGRDLSILTVTYDSAGALETWIENWSGMGARLVVVDNGSSDSSAALAERSERVDLALRNPTNEGFGLAVNRAVSACDSELILITNPDVRPSDEDALSRLLYSWKSEKELLSGMVLLPDGRQLPAGGGWPGLPWLLYQVLLPARPLGRPGRSPSWIEGSLLLTSRRLFEELGGFDGEGFPLYFEDTDLCYRAARQGIGIRRVDEARFIHSRSTGSPASWETRLPGFHWGLYSFFRKHRSGLAAGTARLLLLLKCANRLLINSLIPSRGPKAEGYRRSISSLLALSPPILWKKRA
jgi:N-acetylglucosaminyl-diphospho-decaprenol L-rhamnosyltransferase